VSAILTLVLRPEFVHCYAIRPVQARHPNARDSSKVSTFSRPGAFENLLYRGIRVNTLGSEVTFDHARYVLA